MKKLTEGKKVIADYLGWEKLDEFTYAFPNLFPVYNIDDPENPGIIIDNIDNALFDTSQEWIEFVYLRLKKTVTEKELDAFAYPHSMHEIKNIKSLFWCIVTFIKEHRQG
jgi:hypothetical protein